MSSKPFSRLSGEAQILAAVTDEPVRLRRTHDGWEIVDRERLDAAMHKTLTELEREQEIDRHEHAMATDPEYRRAVVPDGGLSPDPDGDYGSEHWAMSEEDGWFYEG